MNLNTRELHTLLAALRFWQRVHHWGNDEMAIATDCGALLPLDDGEIDRLFQRLMEAT